jgi:hypothetical protein
MDIEEQREIILAFLTHEQDRLRNGEATPPFQIVWGHLVINWLRARLNMWEREIE